MGKKNNLSAHTPLKGHCSDIFLNQNIAACFAQVFYIYTLSVQPKQGGLALLFSRVFFICICARHFTLLYINTSIYINIFLGGLTDYILFGVQTYYYFTFRTPDLSGINFIFIYKVQRLEKIEFMGIFFFPLFFFFHLQYKLIEKGFHY